MSDHVSLPRFLVSSCLFYRSRHSYKEAILHGRNLKPGLFFFPRRSRAQVGKHAPLSADQLLCIIFGPLQFPPFTLLRFLYDQSDIPIPGFMCYARTATLLLHPGPGAGDHVPIKGAPHLDSVTMELCNQHQGRLLREREQVTSSVCVCMVRLVSWGLEFVFCAPAVWVRSSLLSVSTPNTNTDLVVFFFLVAFLFPPWCPGRMALGVSCC